MYKLGVKQAQGIRCRPCDAAASSLGEETVVFADLQIHPALSDESIKHRCPGTVKVTRIVARPFFLFLHRLSSPLVQYFDRKAERVSLRCLERGYYYRWYCLPRTVIVFLGLVQSARRLLLWNGSLPIVGFQAILLALITQGPLTAALHFEVFRTKRKIFCTGCQGGVISPSARFFRNSKAMKNNIIGME